MNKFHRIAIVLLLIAATTVAVIIKKTHQSRTSVPEAAVLETHDSQNQPSKNTVDTKKTVNPASLINEPNDTQSDDTATESAVVNINVGVSADIGMTLDDMKTEDAVLPRLVDFGASKCVACKMMEPILEELSEDYTDAFSVEFVNIFEEREKTNENRIRIIPTQIFYDSSGKELYRHAGYFSKDDILSKWEELGVDISQK